MSAPSGADFENSFGAGAEAASALGGGDLAAVVRSFFTSETAFSTSRVFDLVRAFGGSSMSGGGSSSVGSGATAASSPGGAAFRGATAGATGAGAVVVAKASPPV